MIFGIFDFLSSSRRSATEGADEARKAIREAAMRSSDDGTWDLHEASYLGRVDVVRRLLLEGADPNAPHAPTSPWHCGPTPLSKAICAWEVTADHVEVARLLLARGARVDGTHFSDWAADAVGSRHDAAILALLRDQRTE